MLWLVRKYMSVWPSSSWVLVPSSSWKFKPPPFPYQLFLFQFRMDSYTPPLSFYISIEVLNIAFSCFTLIYKPINDQIQLRETYMSTYEWRWIAIENLKSWFFLASLNFLYPLFLIGCLIAKLLSTNSFHKIKNMVGSSSCLFLVAS